MARGGRGGAGGGLSGAQPASRLARRLGTADAAVVGLGAMIGAGVFAAIGPAAQAAGAGLLVGLLVAAVYPESGGTYVYGRERLGEWWGFIAGWGFVVGKTASCAAMALTFGAYAHPDLARPLAVAAVVALAAVNLLGVRKTALLTRVTLAIVLAALAAVVAASLGGGAATTEHLDPLFGEGVGGILQSAGLLFFAFAGYARIATLGEEVRDPATTIPAAVIISLGVALAVYVLVMTSALLAAGAEVLAEADAPLAAAVQAGGLDGLAPAVHVGAVVASLGVLLSLLVGVSRTTFAMAARRDLPGWLDAVHPSRRVPHRAEALVAAMVVAAVLVTDLRGAIGFSSFAVLTYYAVANASALTLPRHQLRWPRWIAGLGVAGCVVLALTLPVGSVLAGTAVLAVGLAGRALVLWRRPTR